MTIEMYEDVMKHLQIDKYRELIIKQDHKITELEKACEETQELLDKQIEATYRLDKENAELKNKLEHRNCVDCSNHSSKLRMRTLELEKENAELKEKLKTAYRKGMRHMAKALKDYDRTDGAWTDYFEHTVDKVLQREQLDFEEYGTLAEQLTKAKDIIREFVEWATWQGSNCPNFKNIQDKAEQFLKESE